MYAITFNYSNTHSCVCFRLDIGKCVGLLHLQFNSVIRFYKRTKHIVTSLAADISGLKICIRCWYYKIIFFVLHNFILIPCFVSEISSPTEESIYKKWQTIRSFIFNNELKTGVIHRTCCLK